MTNENPRPLCYECESRRMNPVVRADGSAWWYCGHCDRLLKVTIPDELATRWAPLVAECGEVVVHYFPNEPGACVPDEPMEG